MGPLSLFLKEVLPMVADIATITSFVILVVTKLTAIPLLFDWLTRLKASRSIRDFFYATYHHALHGSLRGTKNIMPSGSPRCDLRPLPEA